MTSTAEPRSLWKTPAIVTALIVMLPILGNHFVEDWHWDVRGFVLFGTIIFSLAFSFQFITRNIHTAAYRYALGLTLVFSFTVFWGNWVQAADDVNPAALAYLIVPVVGVIGAVIARFRAKGMSLALSAMAITQAVLLARAFIIRNPDLTPWTAPVIRGFVGNTINLAAFVVAALLFRKAARQ